MTKDNLIVWQKWVDPFGIDEEDGDIRDPIYYDEDIENLQDIENDETQTIQDMSQKMRTTIKVMATPMGIIPINDNTASGKIFNFWIGHTNFNITKKIASIIEVSDGVETLDVFTRYRFRISVGKAFTDSEVMRNINSTIYKTLSNNVY
jgi:hypothetical protein